MLLKKMAAQFLRLPFINPIYRYLIKILINSRPNLSFPLIVNKKIKVFFDGKKFFYMHPQGFDTIAARVYFSGFKSFEYESIKEFAQLIKNKTVFFDIGANTGYYSLLAKSINHNITVHGFEPVPEINKNFNLNCSLNNFEKDIQCEEIALTDFNGDIVFDLPISINFATGGSTNSQHRNNTRSFQCSAMTLDKYCKTHNIEKIDIMKIDTESTEPAVLRGGSEIIKKSRPIMIIEVLREGPGFEIINFLKPLDYKTYAMTDEGLIHCDFKTWKWENHRANYLFKPN